jgi:hypothetical protein
MGLTLFLINSAQAPPPAGALQGDRRPKVFAAGALFDQLGGDVPGEPPVDCSRRVPSRGLRALISKCTRPTAGVARNQAGKAVGVSGKVVRSAPGPAAPTRGAWPRVRRSRG